MPQVTLTVNGKPVTGEVEGRTLLVQLLRENLRLTGTHVGCDTSQCGACVVHVDGDAVKSCTMLALQAEGRRCSRSRAWRRRTARCTRCRRAFRDNHGLQCGFCTPGMVMTRARPGERRNRQDSTSADPRGARRQYLPLHRLS